jgi:serine protease inhibitor
VNPSKGYELNLADRVYYSKDFKVQKGKETSFVGKVEGFKTEDPVKEVNDWVSKETKGIIQNLIQKGELKTTQTLAFVSTFLHALL